MRWLVSRLARPLISALVVNQKQDTAATMNCGALGAKIVEIARLAALLDFSRSAQSTQQDEDEQGREYADLVVESGQGRDA